ncbi:MAG: cell filamentation protein Fic, partial [Bacilli bacterium]|nr:cell filamentation protein Fic [Bacilli bacterium]
DGNGRIHRFLIHNVLSLRHMVPKGLMFPISAVMLKYPEDYDKSLESFSKPLLQVIDYKLDEMGRMRVLGESSSWYSYMDMTLQAEALTKFIQITIEEELIQELNFLTNYDTTKNAIQDIIDMPDRLIDLFIQLCLQGNGKLSSKKRLSHFGFLSDEELAAMEMAVKDSFMQA